MSLLANAALSNKRSLWHRIENRLTDQFAHLWEQLPDQLESQIARDVLDGACFRSAMEVGLKGAITRLRQQTVREISEAIKSRVGRELFLQLDRFSRREVGTLWGQTWSCGDIAAYCLQDHLCREIDRQRSFLSAGLANSIAIDPWSTWEILYTFCATLGVHYSAEQRALLDLALRGVRSLHFWSPHDGIVLAAERPGSASVDEEGRLHGAHVAAGYSDGWGVACWHGLPLPLKYYDADPYRILAEPNATLRRILMERYDAAHGEGAFIDRAGAKVIDSAIQPMRPGEPDRINELLSLDLPSDPDGQMVAVKVICPSTGHVYIFRAPPHVRTVRAALAWMYQLKPEQYFLEKET
jgi:hypothetical protein